MASRKLAAQPNISRTSACQILKNDLLLRPYKKIVEPLLADEHKGERKKMYAHVFDKRGHDEDSILGRETIRHRWNLPLPK